MFYLITYTKKNDGPEDYEFNDMLVVVETNQDVPAYLAAVARFIETKRSKSDYYTGSPELLLSFAVPSFVRPGIVLSFEELVRWILNNCDVGRVYPPPNDFPLTPPAAEVES